MKKQAAKIPAKALIGIAFALSIPFLSNGDKSDTSTPAPKTTTAIATSAKPKIEKFDTSILPEYCYPEFQRLSLETYNECIFEGMSYVQVGNVIGNPGVNRSRSGSISVWQWNENVNGETDGRMSVTFVNDKMTSKAQYGLTSDRSYR